MTRNLWPEDKASSSSSDLRAGRQTAGGGTDILGETMTRPFKMKVCIAREVRINVRIEDSRGGTYCSTTEGAKKMIRDRRDEAEGAARTLVSVNTDEGSSGEDKGLAE
jgi:hypothetical protein